MKYIIAVDVMGSDDAPISELNGISAALAKNEALHIIAFGQQQAIEQVGVTHERLSFVYTEEVVTGDDNPATAFRVKKKSSMMQAIRCVKEGNANAVVSSGNTGAYISGCLFILGRIKGIKRPALTSIFPTESKGKRVIFGDLGAVADPTAENLAQNGLLVSEISKALFNISQPKVALLNIGVEEKKGSPTYIEAHQLLKHDDNLNFVGNIEARYIMDGSVDAIVADGFSGNIALKSYEGMQAVISKILKQEIMKKVTTKIGGVLIKPALKELKETFTQESIGGAIVAGVKAPAIKAHGTTNAAQFAAAIQLSCQFLDANLVENIETNVTNL